jgi:hypothetical protein
MKLLKNAGTFILIVGLFLIGCKKDNNPATNNNQNPPTNPTSNSSGQPLPTFGGVGNTGGVLATIMFSYTFAGFSADFTMGFASLGVPGVNAGAVSVNGNTLGTQPAGTATYYSSFSSTSPSNLNNTNFDGSTHSWSVAGGNGIPAFSAGVTSPTNFSVTAPAQNATISKSSNLAITWDHPTTTDSVLIVMVVGNVVVIKEGLPNSGSATIQSSDMASMSGSGILQVVRYRYAVSAQGGKNYVVVAEIVKQLTITVS